ncbi:MAG: D-alanyl-D-alanine carboxypeptidase/D-alanyl-D-alanine-endopeptidase [Acidobacteria bacterium]|nr:D-alanyl-D-alanine carboxypeptidase/D-alanyl-D-alanine-endopeptidase [Acidobacteriota bacterium]
MTNRRRVLLRGAVAAVGALVAVAVALRPLPGAAQPAAHDGDGAYRGFFAARLVDGTLEVIEERNATARFVPASVLKIATAAAALEHLGADYRWVTRLTSEAPVDGTTLAGDLVIVPGADPTWGRDGAPDALAALARQVRERGLTRVAGDLVVDAGRFPGRRHPLDRGIGDLAYRHGTPAAALAVDEATITVRAAPGAALGLPARIEAPAGVELINRTTTVGRDRHGAGTLDFLPLWGSDTLLVRGEYPISEPTFVVPASDPSPARRAADRLRGALAQAGVRVEGTVRAGDAPTPASGSATALAEHRSPPLESLLPDILTDSHNWYADMLALTLGLEAAGTGRFDDGVGVVSDFVNGLAESAAAPGRDEVWLVDGSGLSPANLVTPSAIVRLLAHAVSRPWGAVLIDALATPGEGTLRSWPRLPPAAAKTGTLRHTVALAGFLHPRSATPLPFCYFVNHRPGRPAPARREIAASLRAWSPGAP